VDAHTIFACNFNYCTKLESTSAVDHFHAAELPCTRVKSRDDPISDRRGDSAVPGCFIYIDYFVSCVDVV